MIRHIVFFSAKNKEDLTAILKGLSALGQIPQVRNFSVRENLKHDGISNEIDVVVYGEFETLTDLKAYQAHPIYEESVRVVRPLRELRFCADVEI